MNKAFEALLVEHFDKFKRSFSETTLELFVNVEGKIIHPGEYGSYREAVSREFLRLLVPHNLGIGNGFVITAKDKISTECDIVIYDSENTPLLQSSEKQRFYPIETVAGIGEVKSTLSKADFKKTINKLAKHKLLANDIESPTYIKRDIDKKNSFNPKLFGYDNVYTFLICKKLDFNLDNIQFELDDLYENDIEQYQKHNMIFSMDDGILLYYYYEPKLKMRVTLHYPVFRQEGLKNRFVYPDKNKYAHFKTFASYVFAGVSSSTILFPNINMYMGTVTGAKQKDQ